MKQLILDPEFGMAGDMLAAAFMAAGVPQDKLIAVMQGAADLLGGAKITAREITRLNQSGIILAVTLTDPPHSTEAPDLRRHLVQYLELCKIGTAYSGLALKALDYLIQAEEAAHAGMAGETAHHHHHHCHLHEAQDIVLDICATAWAADYLQLDLQQVICLTPVHTGGGQIHFSHGLQNVPAPATAALIATHKIPAAGGPIQTELLTPTGAALLAALQPAYRLRADFSAPGRAAGTGFGTKDFSGSTKKANGLNIYLKELPADE